MSAKLTYLLPVALTACLVLGGVAAPCRAADDPAPPAAQDAKPAPPAADAKPALSKEMSALRDDLRAVLAAYAQAPLNTRDNTPGEILDACLALGRDAQVFDVASNQKINAIGCLCWNYTANGFTILTTNETGILARTGYGLQSRPAELLAMFALNHVDADYEMRVARFKGTIADLIKTEQWACCRDADQSLRLVGLSFYLPEDADWKNGAGETWSLSRLVKDELNREVDRSDRDATDRLLGLTYAVQRRIKKGQPIDGVYQQAQDLVNEFQPYALGLENADGSWNAHFFAFRGASRDAFGALRATAFIDEWLILSLGEDRLEDPGLVRSVSYLTSNLKAESSQWGRYAMSTRELDGWMHALHALTLYDARLFRPRDAAAKAVAEKKAAEKKAAEKKAAEKKAAEKKPAEKTTHLPSPTGRGAGGEGTVR
jgi:hypothetical protein